jgi:NADPH:quinone reductase-like Zn-dependent oxidoreductase
MALQIPPTMQALRLHDDFTLHYEAAPVPAPSSTQVLLRVSATAITRSELTWDETISRSLAIPGHDVSGTVVSAPPMSKFNPGDQVFGLLAFNRDGAAADYTLAVEEELCIKPKNLSHDHAAAIPLSALTAWQALFEHGTLKAGTRLLVTAAAGGVGSIAVQIAKSRGAYIIGTCSAKNADMMRQLGVDMVLDYRDGSAEIWANEIKSDLEERGVDMVLDCIGGETLRGCLGIVRKGGIVISVAQPIKDDWAEVKARLNDHVKTKYFVVRPDGSMLENIQELVENRIVKEAVDGVWELNQGREAFEVLEKGHVRGKLVLRVQEPG